MWICIGLLLYACMYFSVDTSTAGTATVDTASVDRVTLGTAT